MSLDDYFSLGAHPSDDAVARITKQAFLCDALFISAFEGVILMLPMLIESNSISFLGFLLAHLGVFGGSLVILHVTKNYTVTCSMYFVLTTTHLAVLHFMTGGFQNGSSYVAYSFALCTLRFTPIHVHPLGGNKGTYHTLKFHIETIWMAVLISTVVCIELASPPGTFPPCYHPSAIAKVLVPGGTLLLLITGMAARKLLEHEHLKMDTEPLPQEEPTLGNLGLLNSRQTQSASLNHLNLLDELSECIHLMEGSVDKQLIMMRLRAIRRQAHNLNATPFRMGTTRSRKVSGQDSTTGSGSDIDVLAVSDTSDSDNSSAHSPVHRTVTDGISAIQAFGSTNRILRVLSKHGGVILMRAEDRRTAGRHRFLALHVPNVQPSMPVIESPAHPNILRRLHAIVSESDIVLLYEDCETNLYKIVQRRAASNQVFKEPKLAALTVQILAGLHSYHKELQQPYGELNLQNVYLSQAMTRRGPFVVKFGEPVLSRAWGLLTSIRAPEISGTVEQPIGTSTASDVWSLGILLLTLGRLAIPFESYSHLDAIEKIRQGEFEELPSQHYSENFRSLVKSMLCPRPQDRLSVSKLLRLPYLRKAANSLGESSPTYLYLSTVSAIFNGGVDAEEDDETENIIMDDEGRVLRGPNIASIPPCDVSDDIQDFQDKPGSPKPDRPLVLV